ncbi:MAG: hypothetical protein OXC83_11570 [Chloroflexi bacterium]|nr:hypothetical protein [Chloroflexota bacterium]
MDWLYEGAETANKLKHAMENCRKHGAGEYILKIGIAESGEVRLGYQMMSDQDPTAGGDEPQLMTY